MGELSHDGPILVLSGTGKTGRRVAERLAERDVAVRIGSRAGDPPFDWEDRATWGAALADCSAAYVSYYPDIGMVPAADTVAALCTQAVSSGVGRLVLLSGRGEEEALRAEQLLQQSGAEWTVVRCAWFNQNFSESFLLEPIVAGEVALPSGDVPEPFLDVDDIADVAVAALTESGHENRVYELTGPRLLSFADAVGEIAAASGREISFVPVSVEDYLAVLVELGFPADVVDLIRYLFSDVLDGRNSQLAGGVQQALGREPRDFADFARQTAATGVWNA